MAAPPARRASPPVFPDELVEEILARFPPDDPARLLRASVVCKTWGSAVSHPSFRRRIHELHRTPPVLGFLHNWNKEGVPNFFPTTASSFSLAAPDSRFWRPLDCRHGRALFLSKGLGAEELLVWEPITGRRQHVWLPAPSSCSYPNAAVFCAADACDHRDCHGGPFRVVFVFTITILTEYEEYVTSACVYSSETGTWGELASMPCQFMIDFVEFSSVLVGRSLLYFMSDGGSILEYDLARNELTVIDAPGYELVYADRLSLMLAEDGGLGLIQELDSHLKLWSREANDGTDARWVLSRTIYLSNLIPVSNLLVLGFAEGANVIFVDTVVGLFTIELLSERVTKVYGNNGFCRLIPVVGFYTPVPRNEHTPVPRNEHQDLAVLNASVEERGEDEEEEQERTADQAQQLFDNGPNAIKEGTSSMRLNVSAMSSDLHGRVPLCGDATPASIGMDTATKLEEVTDPWVIFPEDCTNKE